MDAFTRSIRSGWRLLYKKEEDEDTGVSNILRVYSPSTDTQSELALTTYDTSHIALRPVVFGIHSAVRGQP